MKLSAYFGNPFIGLFAKANNSICFSPITCDEKFYSSLMSFNVPVEKISIANSGLIGVYLAMNSNGLAVTSLIDEREEERIKGVLKKFSMNFYKVESKYTSVGLNIAVNDKKALINHDMPNKEAKEISDALGVEVIPMKISGFSTVGAVCALNNKGFLVHNSIEEEKLNELEKMLNLRGGLGTINSGVPFVSLGLIANDKTYLAGDKTTGFEIMRIDEALEYL